MRYSIILIASFLFTFCSCSTYLFEGGVEYSQTEVYEEFWTFVDEHYVFFDLKDIDWEAERRNALNQINSSTSDAELFEICDRSLLMLEDTHSRLTGPDMEHTPYDFTEGYEVHFSLRNVAYEYMLDSIRQSGALFYGWLPGDIGYVYFYAMRQYDDFGPIIRDMKSAGAKGLVIDVRGNGGGDSDPIPALLSDFTDEEIYLGAYVEKSGPAHDDRSQLLSIHTQPNDGFLFERSVVMITDRKGYSATSYFAAMAKQIPSITVIGQTTGGGAGGNMGYQLSNGWVVAVSVSDFIDADGHSIELGVAPDISIENTQMDIDNKKDPMLEKAMSMLIDE